MKRFFCTICNKVKRVRKLPIPIKNEKSMTPAKREGQCNRHALRKV